MRFCADWMSGKKRSIGPSDRIRKATLLCARLLRISDSPFFIIAAQISWSLVLTCPARLALSLSVREAFSYKPYTQLFQCLCPGQVHYDFSPDFWKKAPELRALSCLMAIDGFGFTYLGDNDIWQRLWCPENTWISFIDGYLRFGSADLAEAGSPSLLLRGRQRRGLTSKLRVFSWWWFSRSGHSHSWLRARSRSWLHKALFR